MDVLAVAAVVPVLAEPSVRAVQVTQLVLGETGAVLAERGEWRQVRAYEDGYEGWVNGGYLREVEPAAGERWRARALGWSEGAVVDAGGVTVRLPLRARVVMGQGHVELPDGRRGTVVEGHIRTHDEVAAVARRLPPERWALQRFEGAPYQWGGLTPWGVDCSGLVQTTFAARAIVLPRDSSLQANAGEPVALDAIHPGDLLFFHSETGPHISHVAFAGAGDTLVHSTIACGGVLRESWAPGSRAWALWERLVAARRVQ